MLTISKPLSSGQAQSYHKLEFTSESQNYYNQGDSVRGEWQGSLAARLGLDGEVSPLEFSRLADGLHPQTGEQLVRHRIATEYKNPDGTTTKSAEHRAGWDATFSAPKSVSLTALVGGDERVRKAHGAAVTAALDELERYVQARIGGNNPAETTGKFVVAKFEHDTARPVDGYAAPQLHTHSVIFNITEREGGKTRALQERGLFDSQQFATAVYQSELMYRLTQLGYEIERGRSGAPEIKGYTQEYLDASSPRSKQIREQLEKTGFVGPEAAQIAAHSTRDRKQEVTAAQALAAHRRMALDFGNQPQAVVGAARERTHLQLPEASARAKEAVTYAKNSVFEREAVADERTILRDAIRRGLGEAGYREIRTEYDYRKLAGEFLPVVAAKHATGSSFTTPETIFQERENIRFVLDGRNTLDPMMSAEDAREHGNSRVLLNASQRRVVEEVLNSSDRIHGLQGFAGSGKTTTLLMIREGAESRGFQVEGFAPTSKATLQLREAGVEATTLQSFLAREKRVDEISPKNLYMLDESSLASSRQMRDFLSKIGQNDRVLLIGDIRQHQGVDAGRPFQQMQEAGMQTSHLDTIVRQKDPGLLEAVQHLAGDEIAKGISLLADQGRVTEIAAAGKRIAAIAKDYAAQPEGTIIVSPDNKSRQQINDTVRIELIRNGSIGSNGRDLEILQNRGDMTGSDRTWAARYVVGDVLQYSRGSKEHRLDHGSYATVRGINSARNTITVETESGTRVTYDPKRLRGVSVYRSTVKEFALGDLIQFTKSDKTLGIANRELGVVTALDSKRITVRVDVKVPREINFDPTAMKHFDHGYAVTSHSSQGLTTRRVLINIDTDGPPSLVNSRLAYVAVSRASEDARIYTNDIGTLGQRLSSEITKTAAIEIQSPTMNDQRKQMNQTQQSTPSQPIVPLRPAVVEEIGSGYGRGF